MAPKVERKPAAKGGTKKPVGILAGGKARELSLIWRPARGDEGACMVGRLVSSEERILDPKKPKPATVVTFAPALVRDANGELRAERSVSTVLSSALALRITPATDRGSCFQVVFLGFEHSEKGNSDWRNYEVEEVSIDALKAALKEEGAEPLADSLDTLEG